MDEQRCDTSPVLGSITSAFGMALGELLLTLGTPEELGKCLSDIHVAAQGTMLSSGCVHPVRHDEED